MAKTLKPPAAPSIPTHQDLITLSNRMGLAMSKHVTELLKVGATSAEIKAVESLVTGTITTSIANAILAHTFGKRQPQAPTNGQQAPAQPAMAPA